MMTTFECASALCIVAVNCDTKHAFAPSPQNRTSFPSIYLECIHYLKWISSCTRQCMFRDKRTKRTKRSGGDKEREQEKERVSEWNAYADHIKCIERKWIRCIFHIYIWKSTAHTHEHTSTSAHSQTSPIIRLNTCTQHVGWLVAWALVYRFAIQ